MKPCLKAALILNVLIVVAGGSMEGWNNFPTLIDISAAKNGTQHSKKCNRGTRNSENHPTQGIPEKLCCFVSRLIQRLANLKFGRSTISGNKLPIAGPKTGRWQP